MAGLRGLLLTEARREARVRNGQLVPLGEQDRGRLDLLSSCCQTIKDVIER